MNNKNCRSPGLSNFAFIKARQKYLVVIAGPTAVGKTRLGIELAKHYKTEILSADSRQFYRELHIGTAKPGETELQEAPHHFINSKSIEELYGSGHYAKDALELAEKLFREHDILFMVGGSGLYIDAVLKGMDEFAEVPPEIREKLNSEYMSKGITWLKEELRKKDPLYFKATDTGNPQRMIRALEICYHTGRPYSGFLTRGKSRVAFKAIKILINTNREQLYGRINRRVDDMMAKGLLEEARALAEKKNLNALKTVGYKELYDYLEGRYDLGTAVEKIKQHTRNYAKRQLTWFRNRDRFKEFEPEQKKEIIVYIDSEIKNG